METDYQSFFENAVEGIYRSTPGGRLITVNPALAAMFGYASPREMIDSITDIGTQLYFDKKDRQKLIKLLKQVGKVDDFEFLTRRKDGTTIWVSINVKALKDKNGNVMFFEGFIRDNSQRKRAEEALRESEQRYKSLFQESHAIMLLIDPDTTAILDANPAAMSYYGWTSEELLKKRVDEINTLTPKEVREEIELARTEKRNQFLFKHRRADGSIRDVEVFSSPIVLGGKTLLYSIIHDITEQKQNELERAISEARYKSLVETQSEVIARSDPQGRLIFVNDAYCQAFGKKREELIGKVFLSTIVPEDQNTTTSVLKDLQLPPNRKTSLTRHITPSGIRWIEWDNSAILDEKGNITELQGSGRDVTEQKQSEQALRKSEQAARQTSERLQMVNQISQKITSGLGFATLMQTIYEQCRQIGDTDTFYVATYNEATKMLNFPFFYKDGEQQQIASRNITENSGLAGYIIQTQKTVYLPNESIMPEGVIAIRTAGIYTHSFIGIPLIVNGLVIGVLSMQSHKLNAYTREQIQTLELLATQVAIAIQNSQLFQQMEEERNLANALIENLPGAVGLIDQHANLLRWNKQAETITGYFTNEIRDLDFLSLFSEEDQLRLPDLISRVFSEGRSSTDILVITRDGREIPFFVTGVRVQINNEDLLLFIGMDISERKKMEQDILQNEAIFSSFMQNSPVYVFFKDKDIRTLRLSSNFDQMLGIPVEQALGKTMDELFPSILAKKMVKDDLDILNEGKRIDVVEEFNDRIYETTKFPIFKDGKPDILAGFTLDVTERKKAEQALHEAEAFNQAIITNSPIGISVRNYTGGLLSANQAWKKIWGIQEEEYQAILLEKYEKLVFDERDAYLEPYLDQVRRVYEQSGMLDLPDLKVRIHRPGIAEWVSQYYYGIMDEAGQVNRVVTLTEDVSSRKRAEAEIVKSRSLLERVQEVAHMGSIEIDLTTRLVTASDEACRIYGVEPGNFTLARVQNIPLDEFRPALDAALEALIKNEANYNIDFKIKRVSDGAIRDIHSVAEVNREENTVIGSIQDITERKEAERELKEQLDLLERMNNVMVDRELRMLEIKKEVNALLLKAGEKEKYKIFDL